MTDRPLVVDLFAAAGMVAHESGLLPDALAELAVRLDIKGAGPLLDQIMHLEWTEPTGTDKRDPKPVPTPKPPQPPREPGER